MRRRRTGVLWWIGSICPQCPSLRKAGSHPPEVGGWIHPCCNQAAEPGNQMIFGLDVFLGTPSTKPDGGLMWFGFFKRKVLKTSSSKVYRFPWLCRARCRGRKSFVFGCFTSQCGGRETSFVGCESIDLVGGECVFRGLQRFRNRGCSEGTLKRNGTSFQRPLGPANQWWTTIGYDGYASFLPPKK